MDAAARDEGSADTAHPDAVAPDVAPSDAVAPDAADAEAMDGPCGSSVACPSGATCDRSFDPAGMCVTRCQQSDERSTEWAECGGYSSTCLQQRDGELGTCATACRPRWPSGTGCTQAQVCTGWRVFRIDIGDDPGCAPFCHSDAECPSGLHCDRLGRCRAEPVDLALLPDGALCDPRLDPADGPSSQCRGKCWPDDDHGTGTCGSAIDLNVTSACPDRPDVIQPIGGAFDDFAVCIYPQCDTDCDCAAPFKCVHITFGQPGLCTVDSVRPGTPCVGDAGATDAATD